MGRRAVWGFGDGDLSRPFAEGGGGVIRIVWTENESVLIEVQSFGDWWSVSRALDA
jgi:hypothetical protein